MSLVCGNPKRTGRWRPDSGFECTIAVTSLTQTEAMLRKHDEDCVERSTIPQVGHLLFFEDPGGNFVGVMKFGRSAK